MPRIKPWLKMWTEWLHDPKMLALTLAEQGAWWRVVTFAQECNADGQLTKGGGGEPLTLDAIATCVHISTAKDRRVFDSMLAKMHAQGSLHWNSKTLTITRFAERQERTPSSTKEAVRERVRHHREQKAVTENPLQPLTITEQPGKRESSKEKSLLEKEAEAEVESNAEKLVTCNRETVSAEASLAEIAKLYEENFGILTPVLSEKFKDFVENYRGPFEWLKEAFAEAVTHNVRKWAYVEAILDRWQQEGRQTHDGRKKPERGAPAHKQDPHAAAKKKGWKVGGEDEGDDTRDQD